MTKPSRFSPEVRDRAVRMVLEHQSEHESEWAAITSIAEKIGCSAETLRNWVRQAERDGERAAETLRNADVLPDEKHPLVALHLFAHRFAQRLGDGEPLHAATCSP